MDSSKIASVPHHSHVEAPAISLELESGMTATLGDKYTPEDDDAMKAIANYDGPPLVLDEATNRRLLRTIDFHLLPVL